MKCVWLHDNSYTGERTKHFHNAHVREKLNKEENYLLKIHVKWLKRTLDKIVRACACEAIVTLAVRYEFCSQSANIIRKK